MNRKLLIIGILLLFFFPGCAALYKQEVPEEPIIPELKWDVDSYAQFVKQNMAEINAGYISEYVSYEFVVDTEYGSTVVQNLIDPEAVSTISANLGKYSDPEYPDELVAIYQYVFEEYDYILDPHAWQSVEETIRTKKGDCKSLSLLFISLLLSAGYDAYAGIANGHMWVKVHENYKWVVMELDQNPERQKIYRIPGFYDKPLYRIYADRSEKRKRKN
jgi:transglutaminase-like putative cysteine protease